MSGGPAGFPHQYGDPNEMPVGRILAGQTRRGLPVANCMNGVTMCLHVAVFSRLNHVKHARFFMARCSLIINV